MPSVFAQAPGPPPPFPLPVGVHPRIFFGPEGLSALKARLTRSDYGRVVKKISDQEYENNKASLQSFAALDIAHADR